MCNPRRIEVTATRQVREAWEREVERVARVAARISGEARIRQPLDASLGGPALTTLQNLLLDGFDGWQAQDDDSFRHDVDGGYVLYHLDERQLEIVATVSEELLADGRAQQRLTGEFAGEVTTRAAASYYDDGRGDQNDDSARRKPRSNGRRASASQMPPTLPKASATPGYACNSSRRRCSRPRLRDKAAKWIPALRPAPVADRDRLLREALAHEHGGRYAEAAQCLEKAGELAAAGQLYERAAGAVR